ncbi:hypothetical protein U0035_15020 [Niabella yanshanensis]|uniref:Lipoprotein n=1 Tax=Niabella yanshanensis TaxID=577386 RepID=A0ABZ0W138_9BACT|nr:hypothetical protein [Niabella yanshanensis]WQD36983.1 hypothetical protein U0035_15020 [Niabella yanshanensis]
MKQLFIIAAIAAFAFTACKSKTTETGEAPATASQYYEKVAELEETMSEPLLTTEAAIKARGDKKDFAGIAQAARAMEDSVDLRINALKKIDPVGKGGADFKIVATRYFEYIKSIYTAYKKIGEAKTEEERMKGADEMTHIINGQAGVMANLQSAQAKFAADNGFTINQ